MTSPPLPVPPDTSTATISDLIERLQRAYDAATPGRSKRWWAGGFGWLLPGVSSEESVTPEAQAFIVAAHNSLPSLLLALRAVLASRDALAARQSELSALAVRLERQSRDEHTTAGYLAYQNSVKAIREVLVSSAPTSTEVGP